MKGEDHDPRLSFLRLDSEWTDVMISTASRLTPN
jgi:hypothetical protein